ncbi:hypothetical protein [Nonomuraea sp. NPDC048901]
MPDLLKLAVDVRCLDCGAEVLRTESDPGDTVQMPDHVCRETPDGV